MNFLRQPSIRTGANPFLIISLISLIFPLTAGLFTSCVGAPSAAVRGQPESAAPERAPKPGATTAEDPDINREASVAKSEGAIMERPEIPPIPQKILGRGSVLHEALVGFLLQANPQEDPQFVDSLARIYIEESKDEGINHDIAFAQMCLETGFLRYGGLVTADMNNFCGLGSIGKEQRGERFPTPELGVRAHVQHLKAYATDAPLKKELVDPRYRWVRYGSAPTIKDLSGRWAADPQYGIKISVLLERLYAYAFGPAR
jgi:hypothetical protein